LQPASWSCLSSLTCPPWIWRRVSLRNTSWLLTDYTVSYPKRQNCSYSGMRYCCHMY
jgi:hypothetical protein